MAEYLIQGSTLTSINDTIRNCLGENTWAINPDYVDNASEGLLSPGAVEAIYAEYIDADNGVENKGDYISQKDIFIAYDFDINNNDEIVPHLYKTDRAGYEQGDEEFMEPDWADPFVYIDTVQLDDGATYDKWLKIDGEGASGWEEGQPKIYMYTEPIVIRNTFSPVEAPEKIRQIASKALHVNGSADVFYIEPGKFLTKGNFVEFTPYYGNGVMKNLMSATPCAIRACALTEKKIAIFQLYTNGSLCAAVAEVRPSGLHYYDYQLIASGVNTEDTEPLSIIKLLDNKLCVFYNTAYHGASVCKIVIIGDDNIISPATSQYNISADLIYVNMAVLNNGLVLTGINYANDKPVAYLFSYNSNNVLSLITSYNIHNYQTACMSMTKINNDKIAVFTGHANGGGCIFYVLSVANSTFTPIPEVGISAQLHPAGETSIVHCSLVALTEQRLAVAYREATPGYPVKHYIVDFSIDGSTITNTYIENCQVFQGDIAKVGDDIILMTRVEEAQGEPSIGYAFAYRLSDTLRLLTSPTVIFSSQEDGYLTSFETTVLSDNHVLYLSNLQGVTYVYQERFVDEVEGILAWHTDLPGIYVKPATSNYKEIGIITQIMDNGVEVHYINKD